MKFLLGFITGVACSLVLFWVLDKTAATDQPIPKETESMAEPTPEISNNLPADFEQFYEAFHGDSVFQLAHIMFPLEGLPPNVDSTTMAGNFRWQKENWVLHRPFNAMDGAFIRDYRVLGDELVIEDIQHESGRYGMERRFAKYDDGWYLIYYAGMNELVQPQSE